MESRHQTSSVIAKLMGLDEVPSQHPVREKQRVLSERYLQKVASIGVIKKRSFHEDHFFRNEEKKDSENVLKVVKFRQRDNLHNLSTRNGKANSDLSETTTTGVGQKLSGAEYISVNGNPETLIESISSFNPETSVKAGRINEQGDLQLFQTINKGLQVDVHGQTGLYEILRFSSHLVELKDRSFNSRIVVLKPKPGRGKSGFKCFSLPRSCEISHLCDVQLKGTRVYPKIKERQKLGCRILSVKQHFRDFGKMSEEASSQMGNAANSSEGMKVTEKLQAIGQWDQALPPHKLLTVSEHGYRARNLADKPCKLDYQSCCCNTKVNLSIRSKVGLENSCVRNVPIAKPLCTTSVSTINPRIRTKDDILHQYWDTSSNWSVLKSKKQNFNQKGCSEDMNLSTSCKKFQSLFTHFGSNHNEVKCIGLHKLKRCYGNDLSDQKPMVSLLSRSGPSTIIDSHEVMSNKLEGSDSSNRNTASPNLSIDCLAADAMTDVVGGSCGRAKEQESEFSVGILFNCKSDTSSHTSYVSMEQETLESRKEDSVYSLFSGTEADSLGSFEEAYESSPISVLQPQFREDISSSSECLKVVGDDIYDSSELDNEGLDLNVSSDEDRGDRSVGDFEEKQDVVEFFGAEESRDFSYVVEVLTEACISNRSLYTDFFTWHSPECPISPSVFEILEIKFGEQPYWKRSDRRLLFDRINSGLVEILQPCMCIPKWEKSVSRRLNAEPSQDMIEEELWGLLAVQEKEARKESADKMLGGEIRCIELGDDIEVIVGEIVTLLMDEIAEEIVSLERI